MRSVTFALLLACGAACAKPNTTPTPPATKRATMGVFGPSGPIANASVTLTTCASASVQTTATNGTTTFTLPYACAGSATVVVTASGYTATTQSVQLPSGDGIFNPANIVLTASLPPAPDRLSVLDTKWTFEGLTCHTQQFGDLPMFDPFYISLNAADRQAWRNCHKAAGDQAMLVGFYAEYGEAGQPYGSGQLVPPTDLTDNWPQYRAIVEETIADGLQPILYMSGDNGISYLEWVLPLAVQALRPQPTDPYDALHGREVFLCFDSCIPGYQPPSEVDEAILAARAAIGNDAWISIEATNGFSSWGDGGGNFQSPAGQQLDKWYQEFPFAPCPQPPSVCGAQTPADQIWQIVPRITGTYVRDPNQPAADDPDPPYYLATGSPRGPQVASCMEKFEYLWVRGQISPAAVATSDAYYRSIGCGLVN